jgi:DNA repair photolyase
VLFPELQPSGLVGIARLAAESDVLDAKRRVEYFDLPTRNFIGRVSGRKMPFDWTINPYRGCEFGCKYCYARYTHEFMELRDPDQFEQLIYAKHFNAEAFRRELSKIPRMEAIAIGTATDPYQPAERRYGITRGILAVFAGDSGRDIGLITKSDLITRDLDLLTAIAAGNSLSVSVTVTTMDEALARSLEPLAPRPSLRMSAVAKMASAGIRIGINACPVMPLINDSYASLSSVARAASEAGACYMMGNPLFLKPCAQKAFFPFLEKEFPHLVRRYRERYERSAFLKGAYPELVKKRIREIRERYGLTRRHEDHPGDWPGEPQLELFSET